MDFMENNMTNIYFIRHAEPNYENHDDTLRELTAKGLKDRKLVTAFLSDKNIDVVISSPYKRAYDTVYDFAYSYLGKKITVFKKAVVYNFGLFILRTNGNFSITF